MLESVQLTSTAEDPVAGTYTAHDRQTAKDPEDAPLPGQIAKGWEYTLCSGARHVRDGLVYAQDHFFFRPSNSQIGGRDFLALVECEITVSCDRSSSVKHCYCVRHVYEPLSFRRG